MAKHKPQQKNKFANNVPPPPVASSSPSLKPVVPKVAATIESAKSSGILVDQELRFDETLVDQFSKALPAQEHDALRAWLEQFATLGKAIKDKIAEVEKKQQQLEQEQLSLLEKQDALKKDREIFSKESAELNPKIEEYKGEMKDAKEMLSGYLEKYQRVAGTNIIEGENGEIKEIVPQYRLVKRNNG